MPDAAVASEIDELARKIPKLIGILPDVLTKQKSDRRHKAALIEMTSALVALVDRARPLSMVSSIFLFIFHSLSCFGSRVLM